MQFHSTMYLPLLWLSVWRPFFIDASRNQTGYIHKGVLVGFDTVVSCDKRGYIVCKLIVDKERIHVFLRSNSTVSGALMLNLYLLLS